MVLDNQIHKPLEQVSALLLRDSIYLLDVCANSEYTLPTRDWVGADNGVLSAKLLADILGSTTWAWVNLEVVILGNFIEARLSICCGQTFQELLVRL
jgi:hypothetical protein